MAHADYLKYKKKYLKVRFTRLTIEPLLKRKNTFFSYFLNFPVLLINYVACCLRKQGVMLFVKKVANVMYVNFTVVYS